MKIEEAIEKLSQSMERYETETYSSSPLSMLTTTQIHYLDAIYHLKDPNVTELASYLNVSKPTVTFAVNKMEKQGYIQKKQSNDDRRFFSIKLTAQGVEMAKLHDEIHSGYAEYFREVLDTEELETLEHLLGKVLKDI